MTLSLTRFDKITLRSNSEAAGDATQVQLRYAQVQYPVQTQVQYDVCVTLSY